MSSDEEDLPDRLVPNRVEGDDVSRRRLMRGTAAAGATVESASTAGCTDLLEEGVETPGEADDAADDGNDTTPEEADADEGTPGEDDADGTETPEDDGEAAPR